MTNPSAAPHPHRRWALPIVGILRVRMLGSAGYVAREHVSGTFGDHAGTFTLQ